MKRNYLKETPTNKEGKKIIPILSKRILRVICFVLLFGLFPLIALWKINLGEVPGLVVWLPMEITILFTVISFGIWLLVSQSLEKAGLLSSVLTIFVFTYGHVYNLIGQKTILGVPIGFVKLLAVYLVLFIAAVVVILLSKFSLSPFFQYANIIIGILLLFNIVPIASFYLQVGGMEKKPETANVNPVRNESQPDIYYIVLDAYSRDDVLRDVLGFDNTNFLDSLRERGFFIPECANSNYDSTMHTIASVLNAEYLDFSDITNGTITNLILHSQMVQVFKSYGYQIVTGKGFNSSLDILSTDIYLNYQKNQGAPDVLAQQEFNGLYADTTILRLLTELSGDNPEAFSWVPYWLAGNRDNNIDLREAIFWYNQNNYMFESLEKLPEEPGAYFVYAHIMAPHPPFVYRPDGSFNYPPDSDDLKILYKEMLIYLNQRVLQLVDVLQQKSSIPPIVIIQADHGLHVLTSGLDKHKILSAYYFPGALSTPPYDTITPVNDFRLILRDYFDPTINLLPDTLWMKFTNEYEPVPASCDIQPKKYYRERISYCQNECMPSQHIAKIID